MPATMDVSPSMANFVNTETELLDVDSLNRLHWIKSSHTLAASLELYGGWNQKWDEQTIWKVMKGREATGEEGRQRIIHNDSGAALAVASVRMLKICSPRCL
jgi:hypothetical protein